MAKDQSASGKNIVDLTFELGRLLKQAMSDADPNHTSTMLRLQALELIEETPNITMKDFAGRLRISASTATAFTDRLVALRWVKRATDAVNRKLVRLHLTPKGKSCLVQYKRDKAKILRNSIASVTPDDQKTLQRILQVLVSAVREQTLSARS